MAKFCQKAAPDGGVDPTDPGVAGHCILLVPDVVADPDPGVAGTVDRAVANGATGRVGDPDAVGARVRDRQPVDHEVGEIGRECERVFARHGRNDLGDIASHVAGHTPR